MARADMGDRIAQGLVVAAALGALGNGAYMLFDPFGWYEWVGTVKASGPPNGHFLRDIAMAFLLSGALLIWASRHLALRWGAALAGAGWLTAHGLLHIWEVASGICAPGIFWQEAPGTLGMPALALSGIGLHFARQRIAPFPLPEGFFVKAADKATFGLSPHLADLKAAPGHALEKFQHALPLTGHGHDAPPAMLHMARLGAIRAEDCGPCVEISARGALAAGLDRKRINAALAGNADDPEDARALAFGAAVASGDIAGAMQLGDEIEALHGRSVRTELSLAAASVRLFPALKRGLGYAQSCHARPFEL